MAHMESHSVQQCTILFADIAGSTALYESLGDEAAKQWVMRLQDRIAATASGAGGRVQEIVGDELMIRFDRAPDAATAALAIQGAVATFRDESGLPLAVRIGLHHGEAIVDGDRMFGDMINVAARVAAIAQGGQIITTRAVVEQLPDSLRRLARRFDTAPVKGKSEPLEVYDLPRQAEDLTVIAQVDSTGPGVRTITLGGNGQHCTRTPQQAAFVIGRDPASDLVIDWPSVSRRHATIEFLRGRFVLSDTSTNGSHVKLRNGQVVFLRRESLPLWGSGQIALGAPADEGVDHIVDYRCD